MSKCGNDNLKCGFDPGSTYCDKHGPAVRKAKPKPAALKGAAWGGPGLTVLPTHQERFAQLLRAASRDPELDVSKNDMFINGERVWNIEEYLSHIAAKRAKRDPWTKKLFQALNVDFSGRTA